MARGRRSDLPDGTYHVVTRGVDSAPVFRDDFDRVAFLELLGNAVSRHAWFCHAYCLMTTHYHLVVESTRPTFRAASIDSTGSTRSVSTSVTTDTAISSATASPPG